MSEDQSTPPGIPPQHEPTEIPPRHEPPPIPQFHEPPPVPEFHEPPPVPDAAFTKTKDYQPARVEGDPEKVLFVVEKSSSRGPPDIPVMVHSKSGFHPVVILSWLGLLLILACIPISIVGAFWPYLRAPFWLTVLTLSFVVICLDQFLKNKPHVSADLVKLTLRLSYGFFFIALIGLVAAAFRAGIYVSHAINTMSMAIHRLAESWHESNGIIAWFLHKADAIMQFF